MKYLPTIGRVLFALPFGIMGLNHFLMQSYYVGMMSTFIPGGGYTIILNGLALIAACISIFSYRVYCWRFCSFFSFLPYILRVCLTPPP